MPTLTWNAAADVSAVGTSDGNDQATSAANPMLSQNLRSDTFGSSIDAGWTQSIGAGHSFVETGGQLTDAITGTDINADTSISDLVTVPSGTALDFEILYSGYAATPGAGEAFWISVIAKNGVGASAGTRYCYAQHYKGSSAENVAAYRENGAGEVQIGSNVTTTATSGGFRIVQNGSNSCEALYDIGSGYVSFGTGALDNANYRSWCYSDSTNGDTADNMAVNFDAWNQLAGGVYWTSAVHTLVNKTFAAGTIYWSTFLATEVGTVEYDYSINAGSSYTGTYRTKAQMQALASESASQLQIRVRFNGGDQTATATVDDISVNTSEGLLVSRIRGKW